MGGGGGGNGGSARGGTQANFMIQSCHRQNPQTRFLSFNTSGASLEAETNCSNTNIL